MLCQALVNGAVVFYVLAEHTLPLFFDFCFEKPVLLKQQM